MKRSNMLAALLALAALPASAQQIEAVTASVDCGQVVFKTPVTAEYEIHNTSGHPIRIANVRTSCGCTTVDYPQGEIASGDSFTVRATYDAKQMGHFSKQIGLYTDRTADPLLLTIKGVVVGEIVDFSGEYPYLLGELRAEKNNIEFDDVNRGDRPLQKIHIMNPSNQTAQPVVMHLPPYLKAEVSPSKIAPKHAGVVTITLDSRQLRDFGLTQTNVFLGFLPGEKVSSEKEIGVSAVLLPDFNNMTALERQQAPHMQLSANELNLGSFGGKKKLKGELQISNTGLSTLDISNMQMFTTGLQVSLNKTRLAPGETARLKVTAIEKDLRQARSKPRVLIITNDPDQPKVVIHIHAD